MSWMLPPELNARLSSHVVRGYMEQVATTEGIRFARNTVKNADGRVMLAGASAVEPERYIDVSWLPAASEAYKISPEIGDYVIAEVPIVEGDVPNRNMDCFLTSRLAEYLPRFGCQAFKTFVGKPTFFEHQHDDPLQAKGVIFDATMREMNGRWFVFILKGFDRTKDRGLAEAVFSGKRKGHSMSAWASFFDCAYCRHRFDTSWEQACDCLRGSPADPRRQRLMGKGTIRGNNQLVYNIPHEFNFFESSSVGDPANYGAWTTAQPEPHEG